MRKAFLLFFLSLLLSCKKDNTFFSSGFGNYIIETTDGGFVITGTKSADDNSQVALLKIDNNGNQEWYKAFGMEIESEHGYTVIEKSDNGLSVLVQQTSLGINKSDFSFLKTDGEGNEVSFGVVGGGYDDYVPRHMIKTTDNEYYLIGYMYTDANAIFDAYLIKITESSVVKWSKQIGGTGIQAGAFLEHYQNGCIIAGYTSSDSTYLPKTYLAAIDADGNELWSKDFQIGERSGAFTIKKTNDNGFIVYGSCTENSTSKMYLLKISNNGDSLWTQKFNGSIFGYNLITQTADNGYLFLIENNLNSTINKTNESGYIIWQKPVYQGNNRVHANCIQETTDGGYIISGYLENNSNSYSIYVAKFDVEGDIIWSKEY